MKKLAIPFAIGIALGLGGSTGAAFLLGGEPESLEESLENAMSEEHGDSTHAEAAHVEAVAEAGNALTAADTHDAPPAAAPYGDGVVEVIHAATPAADYGAAGHPAPAPSPAAPAASAAPPAMTPAALAKLFASMQAREAARVLEHMDDRDVHVILGELGNREAAAILSSLSPERAAVISRGILRGERSTP